MLNNMNLATRLQQRMDELSLTQEALAEKSGVSQTTIHKLITGKAMESRKLLVISSALGVSPAWLQTGKSPKFPPGMFGDAFANTEPAPQPIHKVPLISWVQAGLFCTSPDLFQPGDAEDWIPALKKYGKHTYALRVNGDSMVLPYPSKDSIFPGTIIFVDPDKHLTNGAKVIARIEGTDETTCKVYKEDMGKRFLVPQNPLYPSIEMHEFMHICGVVVGRYIEE